MSKNVCVDVNNKLGTTTYWILWSSVKQHTDIQYKWRCDKMSTATSFVSPGICEGIELTEKCQLLPSNTGCKPQFFCIFRDISIFLSYATALVLAQSLLLGTYMSLKSNWINLSASKILALHSYLVGINIILIQISFQAQTIATSPSSKCSYSFSTLQPPV